MGELTAGPFEGHTDSVSSVAFSPDGQQIVSGSSDQTVRVWDVKMGELTAGSWEGHTGWVSSVAFSPNGQQIVLGSDEKTVRMWDAKDTDIFCNARIIDGWMQGKNSELMFWIPSYYRIGLQRLNSFILMGKQTIQVDLSQFVHGKSWAQCHPH
ncbi:hypothetical protein PILCRDRAFT_15275 [Piloderma croceum F 1598]|uniref:Uncharacterized protein n=1 Tax=Piloderma croceum (strain F 1598) TaxID=765440 RepID=A0A0C3EZK8_PILCF|nr:hypothetical protein PILCRDRAFT_15275 [Piloderma croceum F 1598]